VLTHSLRDARVGKFACICFKFLKQAFLLVDFVALLHLQALWALHVGGGWVVARMMATYDAQVRTTDNRQHNRTHALFAEILLSE
jgi:hypothetical protein